MKIAALTATFPPYRGGAGHVAYHNARILAERGHQVTVFTPRAAGDCPDDSQLPFRVVRLAPLVRMGNAALSLDMAFKIRGFDLIHLHYPYIFGAELAVGASRLWQIPVLLTYHNKLEEAHRLGKRLAFQAYNAIVERAVLQRAGAIASVSHDHFSHLFPALPDIEVPNGVDVSLFSPADRAAARQAAGLPQNAQILLFVGALDDAHRFKNVPLLLACVARLPRVVCVVVGGGSLLPVYRAMARDLNIGERVHFVGAKPPEGLPQYYAAADITVLPSSRTESFGMVLAESMACGTPVVATTLPGVRGVVEHRKTGLLVVPDSLEDLAAAVTWMFDNPVARRNMGLHARSDAVRRFSWNVAAESLEMACEAAVGRYRTRLARGGDTGVRI